MQKTTLLVTTTARLLAILLFLGTMALPLVSHAQEAALAAETATETGSAENTAPASEKWGDERPPDNYVQSKAPKKSDSPYNFIQMGYGVLIMVFMGGFIYWLIRRNPPENDSADAAKEA